MDFDNASNKLVLRPVTPEDTDFLHKLYGSTRAHEMAMTGWSLEQQQDFIRMQFDAQSKYYADQFCDATFDIIECDGIAAGRLYIDKNETEIRVIDIALLPEFTQRGIGSYYLQSIIKDAENSTGKISIHVEHNNPAMKLYQRLGFEHIRDEGIYWFMQWSAEPVQKDIENQENTAS